ncbi:alcohol dehydrogenase catalytic domain-containing protein [Plantibacter sp. VKM Ac-2885]|uniref:zinc-dependent alcohol dehydrogenase n=1 Tax=Plantibacter sp. VKM Ac-2885 TaxID=2783828 RepID=UPI00188D6F3F|nr:alcohol dehydrogenase catalytic domain-containing protein [Plantibacter sp. VKM Ac-2885]MBF4514173.1 alcohol dehydrogenase catalytic domain-containing protein [Plantibacter sp. VKM Ac-2885]
MSSSPVTDSSLLARAAVFDGEGGYEIRSFPVPQPPAGGAVLRVEAVGLCGSDVMQFHGDRHVPGEVSPVIPGHEIVGVIHEITTEAAQNWGLAVGDRVCVDQIVWCGRCADCLAGTGNCQNLHLYGYTKGPGEDGGLWGGYGEYMSLLPNTHLIKAPEGIEPSELTIFEPVANAINWAEKTGVGIGDRVVVQGPGHQGLLCAAVALAAGAAQVIVTGTAADASRLDAASALGVHAVIDIETEDLTERIMALTKGRGATVVFDLTPSTRSVQSAIDITGQFARVGLAGLKHFTPVPNLMTDLITLKSLSVIGLSGSTRQTMEKSVEFLAAHPAIAQVMSGTHVALETLDLGLALLARTAPGQDAVHVSLIHSLSEN